MLEGVCPVAPISLGEGKRMERYDVRALDAWIDSLSGLAAPPLPRQNWLGLVEMPHVSQSR
jgi:hypothetical protein